MKTKIILSVLTAIMLMGQAAYAEQYETDPPQTETALTENDSQTENRDTSSAAEEPVTEYTEEPALPEADTRLYNDDAERSVKKSSTELNITDFGADGTDKNDDFKAIQDALDAAYRGDSVKRTVKIPDGVYYISDCLTIHSYTSLELSRGAKIVRLDESRLMLISADDSGEHSGGYSHSSGISVSGGEWDGNVKKAYYPTSLFSFNHGSDITVKDTYIHNFCGSHGVIFNADKNVTVDNVTIADFIDCRLGANSGRKWYQEALHLDYAAAVQGIVGNAAPLDNTCCRDITVTGCTFRNVPAGVGTHHDYTELYENNVQFSGCRFENIDYSCINAYGFQTLEISRNTAENCFAFANLRKCQGEIYGNITDLKEKADKSTDTSFIKGNQLRIMDSTLDIYGNTFKRGAGGGAVIGLDSSVTFSDNNVSLVSQCGVKATDSSNVRSKGNTIKNCGGYGIYTASQSTVVSENDKISNCGKCGVYATGAKKLTVKSAAISSCNDKGIYSGGSSISISSCKLSGNTSDAVFINSGKCTVSKSVITANKCRGIVVKKATVNSTSNKVYKNASAELYFAAGANGSFKSNTIGGGGVKASDSSNVKLSDNVYRISEGTLKLEKKSYKYTGKAIKPKVTVTFAGKKLKKNVDYKVTYSNNKKRGTATVKITGKGNYKGTLTAKFKIK